MFGAQIFHRLKHSMTARMTALLLCSTSVVWLIFSAVLVWQTEQMTHNVLLQQHIQFTDMLWKNLNRDEIEGMDGQDVHSSQSSPDEAKVNGKHDHDDDRKSNPNSSVRRHGHALGADLTKEATSTISTLHALGSEKGLEFAIYDATTGALMDASSQPALPRQPHGSTQPHTLQIDEHSWLISSREDEDTELVVASPSSSATELSHELAENIGLLALLGLALLIPVLVWALRRGLKPIHHFTEDVATRAADNLAPIETKVPTELDPLKEKLNSLLGQVEQTISREQRFTADAAHELRTPLAAIRLQLELASASQRTEIREKAFKHATSAVDRATHVVSQLLQLARLEHGASIEQQPIDLIGLTRDALNEAHQAVDDVHFKYSGESHIQGQPLLLALVLRNVIDNALRYGGEQTEIFVNIAGTQLTIYDTGCGIDDELKSHLGERFHRPAGQAASGAGLGWSIIMRIIQLHQAHFEFFDVKPHGFGVTFTFLPFKN